MKSTVGACPICEGSVTGHEVYVYILPSRRYRFECVYLCPFLPEGGHLALSKIFILYFGILLTVNVGADFHSFEYATLLKWAGAV